MDVLALDAAVRAAAPRAVLGVAITDVADRATWTVTYADDASATDRAAAQAIVDGWPTSEPAS